MIKKSTNITAVRTRSITPESEFPHFYSENTNSVSKNLERVRISDPYEGLAIIYNTSRNSKSEKLEWEVQNFLYCCGCSELGELKVSSGFPVPAITTLLDKLVAQTKGHTFIMTTNGVGTNIPFEKALMKCENWTLVKVFKNKNSKNTIKMWISNNE